MCVLKAFLPLLSKNVLMNSPQGWIFFFSLYKRQAWNFNQICHFSASLCSPFDINCSFF